MEQPAATIGMLKALPKMARELVLNSSEDEIVDVVAEIRETEKGLADERKLAMTEIEGGARGREWYVAQSRQAKRSYNDMSLLTKIADAMDMSLLQSIGWLLNNGIITIGWKWTPLKELVRELGVEITTAQREITAGDPADVGEVWKDSYPSFKRIEKEEFLS